MMWAHGMNWHTLVWIGMVMFWVLVIVLALTPTKYLLTQANLADMGGQTDDGAVAVNASQAHAKEGYSSPRKTAT